MTKEALKLALEALEHPGNIYHVDCPRNTAITALREAMAEQPAQPQQEPVAWLVDNGGDSILIRHSQNFPGVFVGSEFNKRPLVFGDTSPPTPAQRKPLTDEEIGNLLPDDDTPMSLGEAFVKFARAVEAKLKEKNT